MNEDLCSADSHLPQHAASPDVGCEARAQSRRMLEHQYDIATLKRDFLTLCQRAKSALEKSIAETERLEQENDILREKLREQEELIKDLQKSKEDALRLENDKIALQQRLWEVEEEGPEKNSPQNRNQFFERKLTDGREDTLASPSCRIVRVVKNKNMEIGRFKAKLKGRDKSILELKETVRTQAQMIQNLCSELSSSIMNDSTMEKGKKKKNGNKLQGSKQSSRRWDVLKMTKHLDQSKTPKNELTRHHRGTDSTAAMISFHSICA